MGTTALRLVLGGSPGGFELLGALENELFVFVFFLAPVSVEMSLAATDAVFGKTGNNYDQRYVAKSRK